MRKHSRIVGYLLCFLFLGFNLMGQNAGDQTEDLIHWHSIFDLADLESKGEKKILLQIYTNWCGWCKEMDKTTYAQPHIAQYITENFYPVKFNAETKETIEFRGKSYEFILRPGLGGYHELAAELLNGRFSFPTVVFLNEDLEFIQSIVGFKTPSHFEPIITYFGTEGYKNTPWSSYKKSYKSILMTAKED